jgi:hypothetical protein
MLEDVTSRYNDPSLVPAADCALDFYDTNNILGNPEPSADYVGDPALWSLDDGFDLDCINAYYAMPVTTYTGQISIYKRIETNNNIKSNEGPGVGFSFTLQMADENGDYVELATMQTDSTGIIMFEAIDTARLEAKITIML